MPDRSKSILMFQTLKQNPESSYPAKCRAHWSIYDNEDLRYIEVVD